MMITSQTSASPLSNFLEQILNSGSTGDISSFEIQNDNARILPADSCSTGSRHKRRRPATRRRSENDDYFHYTPPNDYSPPLGLSSHHQQRKEKTGRSRWGGASQITSNDFIVTAPLRRKVYCEPEKIHGSYPPMRSAQIPLKEFASSQFGSAATEGQGEVEALDDCKHPPLTGTEFHTSDPTTELLTSEFLDEALHLLSE